MKVMVLLDKLLNYQWNNYGNDNKHIYVFRSEFQFDTSTMILK